ncbi:ubiquitin-conjugating enzyme E2 variant [Nocardia sp. N2S4-5]|uniref:ubiquitin-conjugating enzyme E2 variant n=1 Tax=Nocardia sp. N2S4-5 TaxID=3351565 RepID=UPI0037D29D99
MEWFWALIAGPALKTVLGALPNLLGEQLRQRGVIREARERGRLSELAEERRNAAQLAYSEQRHRRELLLTKYRTRTASYPLGTIGRLHDVTAADDIRPAVLVSPVRGAAATVRPLIHRALHDIGEFADFAQLHTGGFVSDLGITRIIDGSVEASEIAVLEFPGHPSILLYFEESAGRVDAFAHLGSLFPLTDGRTGFSLRIASFGSGGGVTAPGDGALPTWRYVNLGEIDYPPEEVIATVVTWFVATCVETYWSLRGAASPNLRAIANGRAAGSAAANSARSESALSLIDRINDEDSVFGCRIQQEASMLLELGYADIETVEVGPDGVALVVFGPALSLSFLLDADFPATPPEIFYISGTEREHILLDGATWSPEHTLAEIVEAIG